jgi:hypothetical protein
MADNYKTYAQQAQGTPTLITKRAVDVGGGVLAEAFVAVDASGNVVGSSSTQGYTSRVSVTRPANTTAYTAGDVVGAAAAAIEFPLIGPSGGNIMITSAELEVDEAAVISGMTSFRLHLYSVTPPSALADNAVWDLPSGDRASYLGYIDLGTPVDVGSTLFVQTDAINKHLKLAGTSLFGYLVTNGGYTPSSASVRVITLHSVAL